MSLFKQVSFVVIVCLLTSVVYSAKPASKKTTWTPVDESDWAVYMSAPAYHFDCAKAYLKTGRNKKAAAELERGASFLKFQKERITDAIRQIEFLKKEISAEKSSDTIFFDLVVKQTMSSINMKYRMIPVNVTGNTLFGEAHEYHMHKAKANLKKSNTSVSTDEIRQVAAFIKLKAASMGITPWSEVDSAAAALEQLAVRIETGKVKKESDLDDVYKKATAIFRKKGDKEISKATK
jgi:hypothetical protein